MLADTYVPRTFRHQQTNNVFRVFTYSLLLFVLIAVVGCWRSFSLSLFNIFFGSYKVQTSSNFVFSSHYLFVRRYSWRVFVSFILLCAYVIIVAVLRLSPECILPFLCLSRFSFVSHFITTDIIFGYCFQYKFAFLWMLRIRLYIYI